MMTERVLMSWKCRFLGKLKFSLNLCGEMNILANSVIRIKRNSSLQKKRINQGTKKMKKNSQNQNRMMLKNLMVRFHSQGLTILESMEIKWLPKMKMLSTIWKSSEASDIGERRIQLLNAIIAAKLAICNRTVQMKPSMKAVFFVEKTPMIPSNAMKKYASSAIKLVMKLDSALRKTS